jgi:hypothetical protein
MGRNATVPKICTKEKNFWKPTRTMEKRTQKSEKKSCASDAAAHRKKSCQTSCHCPFSVSCIIQKLQFQGRKSCASAGFTLNKRVQGLHIPPPITTAKVSVPAAPTGKRSQKRSPNTCLQPHLAEERPVAPAS